MFKQFSNHFFTIKTKTINGSLYFSPRFRDVADVQHLAACIVAIPGVDGHVELHRTTGDQGFHQSADVALAATMRGVHWRLPKKESEQRKLGFKMIQPHEYFIQEQVAERQTDQNVYVFSRTEK